MTSEIEEEAQRLNEKLQYWAETLGLPMDDINADAASWFEYVTKSDDPLITEFTGFVNEKVALHTPDYPILVLIFWLCHKSVLMTGTPMASSKSWRGFAAPPVRSKNRNHAR